MRITGAGQMARNFPVDIVLLCTNRAARYVVGPAAHRTLNVTVAPGVLAVWSGPVSEDQEGASLPNHSKGAT